MTALAVYALCAIVLAAGNLVVLSLLSAPPSGSQPDASRSGSPRLDAAFADSGLRRLAPPSANPQPRSARPDGMVVLQGRFHPGEARKEVARLYYIWAARTHFFSALIALAARWHWARRSNTGCCRLSPDHPNRPSGVDPGRADSSRRPRPPRRRRYDRSFDRGDLRVPDRVEWTSRSSAAQWSCSKLPRRCDPDRDLGDPASISQIPDRLVGALEEGHRALSDAIERLSATTDGLASTAQSSIEALESTFRVAEQRQLPAHAGNGRHGGVIATSASHGGPDRGAGAHPDRTRRHAEIWRPAPISPLGAERLSLISPTS